MKHPTFIDILQDKQGKIYYQNNPKFKDIAEKIAKEKLVSSLNVITSEKDVDSIPELKYLFDINKKGYKNDKGISSSGISDWFRKFFASDNG